ncbi:MAG TPA: hypothetical protein VKP13_09585 [Nitrospira sp.]|nr:hypothetical protein [Nitrospira sp.]
MPTLDTLDEETRNQLAALSLSMSQNPATRKNCLKLAKTVSPSTPIPEVDQEEATNKLLAERDEKIEKLSNEFNDYRMQNSLSTLKNSVQTKYSLRDEDMAKMEEMMGKKELPADYEFAARLYQMQIEPAAPSYTLPGIGPADLPQDEGLMEDEARWSLKTAHSMIDDMQKKHKPAF